MKEKILFVNSCVRGDNESRTLALAKTALSRLDGDIEEIRLADANLKPLDAAGLAKRAESAEKNDFSGPVYDCAKQFAACDTVVIAAPFWDYSFPAFLKIYIESLCVGGLTFLYGSDGKNREQVRKSARGGGGIRAEIFQYRGEIFRQMVSRRLFRYICRCVELGERNESALV